MPIPFVPIIPPRVVSPKPQIPENVEIGDIIVVRYTHSDWAKNLPWEGWHHAAIVSKIDPLTIIEAVGRNIGKQLEGPTEVSFKDSVCFGRAGENLIKMKWLKPVFPDPIREIDKKEVKRSERKIISKVEARQRAVNYARDQIGEPYKLKFKELWEMRAKAVDLLANDSATKWDENEWYCSLLIFKAYSRTVTGMYLENYSADDVNDPDPGFFVTPEDIVNSRNSEIYHTWSESGEYEIDEIPSKNV